MASSLSTSVERKHLGLSVLTTSGSDFPSAGTDGLRGRVSHAQTSIFPGADDWSGRIRHGPGTDWLTIVLAASARPHPGYFLVFRQGCFLYVGGIMVLFLFVIMLVNIEKSQKEEQFNKQWVVGILAAVALGVLFVLVYTKGKSLFPDRVAQLPEQSNTQQIAVMLYGNYMFTFEIASLLLLVAIIGAVVMAKKRI